MGLSDTFINMELIPDKYNSIEPSNDIQKASNYQEFEGWERMTGERESQGVRLNQRSSRITTMFHPQEMRTYLKRIKTGSKRGYCSSMAWLPGTVFVEFLFMLSRCPYIFRI